MIHQRKMNKKLVVCIVGESGTGKSTAASFFTDKGFNEVQSHTDRPKRSEDEDGHIFETKESFDTIREVEKIATTVYGDFRYCTTHNDIKHTSVFVVDENGLNELLGYSEQYRVISIRMFRNIKGISDSRAKRNLDQYKMKNNKFDAILFNNGSLNRLQSEIDKFAKTLVIHNVE